MAFDSLDMLAAGALFAAGVGAWCLAGALRAHARLYLRFAAMLLAGLSVAMPLGLADAAALLLLPLAAAALMIAALACLARPLPIFAASLALSLSLAGGLAALLSGSLLPALLPVMLAGLAIIAAGLNGVAPVPLLSGIALTASALAFLEQGAHAGAFLLIAAALVGLAGNKPRQAQLLRSSTRALRAERARP